MKKRALFILHLTPPVHGSSMVGQQIKDSDLINSTFASSFVNINTSDSVDNIGAFNLKKILLFIKILFQIISKLVFNRYDVIYMAPTVSKGGAIKDGIIILFINMLKKNSSVFLHLHNKGVSIRNSLFWKGWYKMFFKSKKVIVLSERLYLDISNYVAIQNVFVCANGIDKIDNINKKRNKVLKILYLSNLIKEKGILDLIEACAILKKKDYIFTCDIVGGQGDVSEKQLQLLIKDKNLTETVRYLGKKYNAEKQKVFEESDIFCFPTYYHNECFPLVLLEAIQAKLPVISTDVGGIADIIDDGKNGFTVEIKSPDQIADKISYFIENPEEIKRMGENGYQKFLENYTSEIFEKRLLQILNS